MQENNELSLFEIFNKLFKNKWLIIIITSTLFLLSTILLFSINKRQTTINTNFNYSFLGSDVNKFPNGEVFDYRIINEESFLEEIVESDSKYENIKVSNLINNNKVVIDRRVLRNNLGEELDSHYVISLSLKDFNNDEKLLKSFVNDIHNKILTSAKDKYQVYVKNLLTNSNNESLLEELTYIELISELKEQYENLVEKISTFSELTNNPTINDNISVDEFLSNLTRWYKNNAYIDLIEHEVVKEGYIWNEEKTNRKINNIDLIDKKIIENQSLLDDYTKVLKDILEDGSSVTGTEVIINEMHELTKNNHLLSLEKEYYEKVKDNNLSKDDVNDEAFDNNVKDIINTLNSYVNEFNEGVLNYNINKTRVSLYDTNEFFKDKPLKMSLVTVVSLILSFTIGVTTALIKESYQESNKEN